MTNSIFFVDEVCPDARENNAGSKAREDIASILASIGLTQLELPYDLAARRAGSAFARIGFHMTAAEDWEKILAIAQANDTVIVQFPLLHHTLLAKKPFRSAANRGVKLIFLIHDLDFIRAGAEKSKRLATRLRIRAEELSLLECASAVIVHNERMKRKLVDSCGVKPERILTLEIFDYLIPSNIPHARALGRLAPIVIAGNLRRGKASYIYDLPQNVEFNLYGFGYEDNGAPNIHYKGEFAPEELPAQLEGSFGLIWDGDSAQTCAGPYGSYLRINNPHKTSLYLAAGLPVIIWEQAALAPFVTAHGIGVTVSNLDNLSNVIDTITDNEYARMKSNVREISAELRSGNFTKRAIEQASTHANTNMAN